MRDPPGRRISVAMEYVLLLPVVWVFRYLPESLSRALARGLAELLYVAVPTRRRVGLANLAIAYPELSPAEHRLILKRSYQNLARTLAELVRLPLERDDEIRERVRYAPGSLENLLEAERRGKGVIIATAHMGNWELMALAHSLHGSGFQVVARPLRNGLFNRDLQRLRTRGGNRVCERRNASALRQLARHLRAGGTVGMLVDHCPRRGLLVPFFDVDTLCHRGPAVLALKTGASVVAAFIRRDEGGKKQTITITPRLSLDDLHGTGNGLVLATSRLQSLVEKEIRSRPEDWLWVHRRWKRSPAAAGRYPVSRRRRRRQQLRAPLDANTPDGVSPAQ